MLFDSPVLEDADSIQITLGQIMRMIVCRQVDTKSAGLLLYALQIASANLRRTQFEPYHRNVTVDLFRVPERIIGDEAWSPADFKDANGADALARQRILCSADASILACFQCVSLFPSSATERHDLQKAARAIPRALKGDWRDVKTLFEFAGIYPAKDNSSATDP